MAVPTALGKTRWMIYGANGYTGTLAARLPRPEGMQPPILAGRTLEKIKPLADSLGFEYRIFNLNTSEAIDSALQDVFAVVVAAGPFVYTSNAFVDACLRTKTHYLDITGEYQVFEAVLARHQESLDAGVTLLPGIGMDVVPTDCMASRLKGALPSATHLQMALLPTGVAISPGTMKTMVLGITEGTLVRRNGALVRSDQSHVVEWDHPKIGHVHTAPLLWGDISTAFRTTGIPNIGMYLMVSPGAASFSESWKGTAVRWIASWSAGRWMLNKLIERYVHGPTPQQNADSRVHFSGMAWDINSKRVAETSLTTVEGYQLTALSMVAAIHKLETSHKSLCGALTPSLAFGTEYVTEFEHSEWGPITVRDAAEGELEARTI